MSRLSPIIASLPFAILFIPLVVLAAGPNDLTVVPLGQPISDLYDYSLRLVGLAVFAMFLYAGLLIIVTGDRTRAIQIAKDAVIGLVLLFSAYIILNTINPALVKSTGSSSPVTNTGP